MLNVRSRIGVVAVTTSAAVLLAVPVVASGQVPGVDQVVGGVTETAESLVPAPAPAPPAPQVQAPAPAQQAAPQSAQAAPAPAQAPAPSSSGSLTPAAAPSQRSMSGAATTSSGGGDGKASGSHVKASAAAKRGAKANAAADDGAKASQASQADEPTDVQIADQAVELPEDASPSTLPFTGLQLALMAMVGLAILAGGTALRRGARERRA